jgi:hypothetical protein
MKTIVIHHRPSNQLPNQTPHKFPNQVRGSIMIWTVMLGLLLTSVFFFFSMRQRAMLNVQRDTTTIQNAKLFLESYADYFEAHPSSSPTFIDSVTGSMTKNVDAIENAVDFGNEQEYAFTGAISFYVEWNRCSEAKGDLLINEILYKSADHSTASPCKEYGNSVGPISATTSLKIETLNTPFFFRIKPASGSQLVDNRWHLELTKDLDYGKKITVKRTF